MESAVWETLTQAITNPGLIAKHLDKLCQRPRTEKAAVITEIKGIDRQIKGIDGKSNRLLDAYTAGAVSLERMTDRMSKIEEEKENLGVQRCSLLAKLENGASLRPKPASVEDICKALAKQIRTMEGDFEARRQLLTLLVTTIIIDGRRVRIRRVLPASYRPGKQAMSHIASLSSGRCGRNATSCEFELVTTPR